MQDNNTASGSRQASQIDQQTGHSAPPRLGGLLSFARRHPALTVLGAAGVGLLGGAEVALGAVLGAGVAVLVGRGGARRLESGVPGTSIENDATELARTVRQRARQILDSAPAIVKQRARAVVQAARGEIQPAPQSDTPASPPPESASGSPSAAV